MQAEITTSRLSEIRSILKAGYGKTATCRIVSESQNLKMSEGTTLLCISQDLVFVFEIISALQSHVSDVSKYGGALEQRRSSCGIEMEEME